MEALPPPDKPGSTPAPRDVRRLTRRENEILQLLPGSLRRHEIATHLGIAENTVKAHLTAISRKLDARGRAAIVERAIELNLLDPDATNQEP